MEDAWKELAEKLHLAGLKPYERDIYLTILRSKSFRATQHQIAGSMKDFRLRRKPGPGSISQALRNLVKHGLIARVEDRPLSFRLRTDVENSWAEYVESLVEQVRVRNDPLCRDIVERVKSLLGGETADIGLIRVVGVGSDERLFSRTTFITRRMYRSAQRSIKIMTRRFDWVRDVQNELTRALRRGVDIRILASKDLLDPVAEAAINQFRQEHIGHFDIAHYNPGGLTMSIVDDVQALVVTYRREEGTQERPPAFIFTTDNEYVVKELLLYSFDKKWPQDET